jgi:hypothetical protein
MVLPSMAAGTPQRRYPVLLPISERALMVIQLGFVRLSILVVGMAVGSAHANSLIVFDSHNRGIGYYQGTCGTFADIWKVYSATAYFACMYRVTGEMQFRVELGDEHSGYITDAAFEALGCIGDRFSYTEDVDYGPYYGGYVISGVHNRAAYTKNDGQLSSLVALASRAAPFGTSCATLSGAPLLLYALPSFDNDPGITRFSNVAYDGPLRIQPAPDSVLDDITFFDGFE